MQNTWRLGVSTALVLAFAPCAPARADGLIAAVKAHNRPAIRALVRTRGAVAERAVDGTTALHWSVRADDVETTKLLLRAGADANAATRYRVTPLMLAALNGNAAIVDLLLAAGADPKAGRGEGETVLMTAARTGNPDVVKALIAHGADPNVAERWLGETALMRAAVEDHAGVIRVLAEHGADLDQRSALSTIPQLKYPDLGLITMEFPRGGWTPLMYASRQGAIDAVRALADEGADLDAAAPDGTTALVLAVINAHFDTAAVLLEEGANPDIADSSGMTPLYAAVDMHMLPWMQGRPAPRIADTLDSVGLVGMLLAYGADPNARLNAPLVQRQHTPGDPGLGAGTTPFIRAAKTGDVAMMRMLLAAGADPSIAQRNHSTALMIAAGMGWRDGFGALPTWDRGTEAGALEAITLCLQSGIDINAPNDAGDTALHGAIVRDSSAIIRFLVEHGARLDAKNKQGRTPLDAAVASRRDRADAAALLRELMGRAANGSSAADGRAPNRAAP